MDNKIITEIISIFEGFDNPETGKPFKINKDFNVILKDGNANISIEINPKNINLFENLRKELQKHISLIKDIVSSKIILTSNNKIQNNSYNEDDKYKIDATNIIAVASGKGGVGKSTVAVNIAVALKELGHKVALLDADIYGPSIPRMMNISSRPKTNENKKLMPLENYGIKCMSIGFLISSETPAIWRGPMTMKALEQLFITVEWGKLDYMIVDLPPGTGDVQLSMAQKVNLKGAIIVSTPQDIALIDVRKGINMFKKVNVPVIGIIENMSYFICDKCNERHEIFSSGGAKKEAHKLETSFLGELPIDINLRIQSDKGTPVCINEPNSKIANRYFSIAKKVQENLN